MFHFALEPKLEPSVFVDVLRRSTLAERRPVERPETIVGKLAHDDTRTSACKSTIRADDRVSDVRNIGQQPTAG
jgi:hypothetical protein